MRDPLEHSERYETDEEIREQEAGSLPRIKPKGGPGMTGQQGESPGTAADAPGDEPRQPTGTGNSGAGVPPDREKPGQR